MAVNDPDFDADLDETEIALSEQAAPAAHQPEPEPEAELLEGTHAVHCDLDGRIQFMTANDCATRGGRLP